MTSASRGTPGWGPRGTVSTWGVEDMGPGPRRSRRQHPGGGVLRPRTTQRQGQLRPPVGQTRTDSGSRPPWSSRRCSRCHWRCGECFRPSPLCVSRWPSPVTRFGGSTRRSWRAPPSSPSIRWGPIARPVSPTGCGVCASRSCARISCGFCWPGRSISVTPRRLCWAPGCSSVGNNLFFFGSAWVIGDVTRISRRRAAALAERNTELQRPRR